VRPSMLSSRLWTAIPIGSGRWGWQPGRCGPRCSRRRRPRQRRRGETAPRHPDHSQPPALRCLPDARGPAHPAGWCGALLAETPSREARVSIPLTGWSLPTRPGANTPAIPESARLPQPPRPVPTGVLSRCGGHRAWRMPQVMAALPVGRPGATGAGLVKSHAPGGRRGSPRRSGSGRGSPPTKASLVDRGSPLGGTASACVLE
jgi:hypothetical protein